MRLPKFANLDIFVKKANTGISPSISVSRDEAQHIAKEYLNLVKYTLELQDRVVTLESETNNPTKIDMMEMYGIKVTERVPLNVGMTLENMHYLDTKVKKSGHFEQ